MNLRELPDLPTMRTIKFRVWDTYKKVFIPENAYGLIYGQGGAFGIMLKDWEDYKEGEFFYPQFQVAEKFTGLLDKNGKEIYEGDRVNNKFGVGIVVWNQVCCAFQIEWEKTDLDSDKTWFPTGIKTTEIIGNIHENGELLNGE
jgi:hypothetical protein